MTAAPRVHAWAVFVRLTASENLHPWLSFLAALAVFRLQKYSKVWR
jgi:hypothetical protein